MPANLPPQYYELEREFKAEKDTREKLRLAQELLRMMPKHKGTDHLQADMKTKISNLKKEIASGGQSHGARQVQAQARCHKHRNFGCGLDDRHNPLCRCQQMLVVVHDEQHVPVRQIIENLLTPVTVVGTELVANRLGNSDYNIGRIGQRREFDKIDAIAVFR